MKFSLLLGDFKREFIENQIFPFIEKNMID